MFKPISILCIFFIAWIFKGYGQQPEFKLFKADAFEISYPQTWTTAKDGKVYNFYLNVNLGDISISVYKNSNWTSEAIQNIILDLNERRPKNDIVKISAKGKTKEYNYEYIEKGVKWLIRGIKSKSDFYLVTLNWNVKDWDAYSTALLQSFNSFKIK